MSKSRLLIVFVKAPRPGEVKTRLAQSMGPEAACQIYRILVERVLKHVESVGNVEVRYAPDDAAKEVEGWARKQWQLAPQGAGDLGQRLNRAFRDAFARGFEQVAIIGSDSPDINAEDFEETWEALNKADAVFGPTRDGGYWLIALRRGIAKAKFELIFEDIPWSTESVFDKSVAQARQAGLAVHRLRELIDIDTERDWRAYLRRNASAQLNVAGPAKPL